MKSFSKLVLGCLAMVFCAAQTNADLIENGSFEVAEGTAISGSYGVGSYVASQPYGTWSQYSSIYGWTAASDAIELDNHVGEGIPDAIFGNTSEELNANTNSEIYSNLFNTVVGTTYTLTYYQAGRSTGDSLPIQTLAASLRDAGGNFMSLGQTSVTAGQNWTVETFTFSGTGTPVSIDFAAVTGTSYGNEIDNVHVNSVPEPSSFALLGLGGIGLVFGAYRRRRIAFV